MRVSRLLLSAAVVSGLGEAITVGLINVQYGVTLYRHNLLPTECFQPSHDIPDHIRDGFVKVDVTGSEPGNIVTAWDNSRSPDPQYPGYGCAGHVVKYNLKFLWKPAFRWAIKEESSGVSGVIYLSCKLDSQGWLRKILSPKTQQKYLQYLDAATIGVFKVSLCEQPYYPPPGLIDRAQRVVYQDEIMARGRSHSWRDGAFRDSSGQRLDLSDLSPVSPVSPVSPISPVRP
ncbi:MAG: hypothetical protein M1825_002677 [Sarcosagium campestre]|nr:MAG: hypothetical protein M1825_002677 [Sarcosagium campestre]